MNLQLPLFGSRYPPRFLRWAQRNEHIVKGFIGLARNAKRRGMQHWSADAVVHVLRFQTAIRERSASGFKINNIWVSWLATLAMERYPELQGFFATRKRPTVENTDEAA